MKSYLAKTDELNRQWYVIDATDAVVGRLAAQIAPILGSAANDKTRPQTWLILRLLIDPMRTILIQLAPAFFPQHAKPPRHQNPQRQISQLRMVARQR